SRPCFMVSGVSGLPPISEKRWLTSSTTDCGSGRPPVTRARYSGISSTASGVPCASSRIASAMPHLLPGRAFAHEPHHRLHVLAGCAGNDAVAEVEDVPRAAGRLIEDLMHAGTNHLRLGEERDGIEIALNRATVIERAPGLIERRAPVE